MNFSADIWYLADQSDRWSNQGKTCFETNTADQPIKRTRQRTPCIWRGAHDRDNGYKVNSIKFQNIERLVWISEKNVKNVIHVFKTHFLKEIIHPIIYQYKLFTISFLFIFCCALCWDVQNWLMWSKGSNSDYTFFTLNMQWGPLKYSY